MKKGRLAAGIFILCLQSIAGTQWNIAGEQKAYGAELFADEGSSENFVDQESSVMPEPTVVPEITMIPEPTFVPVPTDAPDPSPCPLPTPGFSLNIENLNIYPEKGNQEEELFGDGNGMEGDPEVQVSPGSSDFSGAGASSGQKEELIRQPKILLESCSLTGKNMEAGSSEEVEFVLKNKSSNQEIYNLKLVFSTETPGIQFEKNSFYFEKISPGGRINVLNRIRAAADTKEGTVPITLSFEYEDKKGTSAAGTEKMEFLVKQKIWANLDCDNLPAEVYSTDTVNMGIRVQNVSRTGIFNARVALEGTGMFPKEEIFLGNMDAGTESTGTMRIFVGTRTMETSGRDEGTDEKEMYGNVTGKITLRYEDGEGKHYEQVREYETKIQKPRLQTLNIEKPKKANSWWYSVAAAAACGMICLILLLMHRIRKQKILLEEMRQEVSGGKM